MRTLKYCLAFIVLCCVCKNTALSQIAITSPKEGAVSAFTNQAIIGNALPNMPIVLLINGVQVDSSTVRLDGVFEFLGVSCPRGPVTITASVLLKNGKSFKVERNIHILGDPDSIAVTVPMDEVPADGQTVLHVNAVVLDKWRVAIPSGYFVTIEASHLTILEEDVDRNTVGHQLRLTDGSVAFSLRAGEYVGPVVLTLSTNGVGETLPLYAKTPSIPFMLVGSADGTLKQLSITGSTSGLSPSDEFSSGLQRQGRIAATARGNVFDDYMMTLSLDTDRKLQDRIFRDLDPNSLYSMYGDNSIVSYEAQSTSPLFVKLEKNQSYALYGDFNTQLTKNEFASYNRSFTGGRLHLQNEQATFDVFGTVTNRKVVQEEIRGIGISGYYYLGHNNLVTGSEKVRLEIRDRFRSEVVISSKEKARYSDYEIDYVQGSLYFKQPVPSLDDQGNPVYIVISFEAITNKPDNAIIGGAGEITLFNALTLGATTVIESREPKNYTLQGINGALNIDTFAKLKGEAARSSDVAVKGSAWKIEAELTPMKALSLRPYYRKVDGTFVNATQSGSGREVGTTKYGGTMQLQPFAGTTIGGEFCSQYQAQGTFVTDLRSMSGSVQQSLWTGSDVTVKVENVKYDGNNPEAPAQNLQTQSTLLSSKARIAVIEGLTASAEYERNLRKSEREVRPDAVAVGAEYQVSQAISLYAQQKFLQGQGQLTTIGVNTKVTDETSVYSRYEIGNSISGERNAATIGLKNSMKLTDELSANVAYEKTKNLSKQLDQTSTDDHDALSLSLEYLPTIPLKTTLKGEYGEDGNNLRKGFDFGLTYRLFNDFSMVTKATNYRAESKSQAGATRQQEYLFGFAYRPSTTNWLNIIAKVEHKVQDNTVVQPTDYYRATIATAHAYVEPISAVEIGLKYAMKDATQRSGGQNFSTLSDYVLVRPQYDLTKWMNVAGEMRLLRQRGANDLKVGYSGETGFVFIKNTIIALGYNFQAYKDRDLVEYIYSVAGPYVTIRLKFTEELFGLEDKD